MDALDTRAPRAGAAAEAPGSGTAPERAHDAPLAYPVTVAVCTFNRADRLPALVERLRGQSCDLPFRLLFVDNNSGDDTPAVLARLAAEPGVRLDVVREPEQGIVPARNRAIAEALASEYLLMMDDDELPLPGWVQAAVRALRDDGADCAGGRVRVVFSDAPRPRWLGDELLGFLGQVDYGVAPFRIVDPSTPIWTGNGAYRAGLFRSGLRFDARFSRVGHAVGGGEDVAMFRALLGAGARLRYVPDMIVEHHVEAWRLTRRYFLRLHLTSGFKHGRYELGTSPRSILGVPPFLFGQALRQGARFLGKWITGEQGALRQGMNFTHACGMIAGAHARWRDATREASNASR